MDNSYHKEVFEEVIEEYQFNRNNLSTSSSHFIISDVKDETNI